LMVPVPQKTRRWATLIRPVSHPHPPGLPSLEVLKMMR
jgi:hypothetical protein